MTATGDADDSTPYIPDLKERIAKVNKIVEAAFCDKLIVEYYQRYRIIRKYLGLEGVGISSVMWNDYN